MQPKTSERFTPTKRTRLKRLAKRAFYERRIIYQILDEAFICHVGFIDSDQPVVIPTAHGRSGNILYLHGSVASRMLRALANRTPICVTVTLLDGLVLARSAFHHSMNYRSVVIFGVAAVVKSPRQKLSALRTISDHILPGRWADVRRPNKIELQQTLVLRLSLREASAKVRSGPPVDEEADYNLPVWAGEMPVSLAFRKPIADSRLRPGIRAPIYIRSARVRSSA